MTPQELVGLLADRDRLAVVSALALGATSTAEIAEAAELDAKAVGRAMARLATAGLVGTEGGRLVLRANLFAEAVRDASGPREQVDHGYADQKVEAVLRNFVRDGRLAGMPAQRSKRTVLLAHIAQSIEPGRDHTEREVDAVLRAWCEGSGTDHATLRRYLVDEGLLSRENGRYWRSGGWLDVLS